MLGIFLSDNEIIELISMIQYHYFKLTSSQPLQVHLNEPYFVLNCEG